MKKADKRNMMAPVRRPNFRKYGKSPLILRAAKHKAASVPGAEAFLMGLINLSNSSDISQHIRGTMTVQTLLFSPSAKSYVFPLIQPLIPSSVFVSFDSAVTFLEWKVIPQQ